MQVRVLPEPLTNLQAMIITFGILIIVIGLAGWKLNILHAKMWQAIPQVAEAIAEHKEQHPEQTLYPKGFTVRDIGFRLATLVGGLIFTVGITIFVYEILSGQ